MTLPWGATHLDRRPADVMEVATDSLGLYVAPPVSHLELAARVPDYVPTALESLMEQRRLVGLRCLRGSAFLMPSELLPVIVPATRDRNVQAFGRYLERNLTTATYDEWAARIDDLLGDGMMSKADMFAALEPPEADRPFMSNVVSQMATESRLIGVRRPISWRSARIEYTRWENWLPDVDVTSPEVDDARTTLARWYFERFGPASIEDFSWWSGLTKTQSRTAVIDAEIVPTEQDDVFGDATADDRPTGVRLLPIWDTLFVTWKDRSRLIPGELMPYIYDASGNATSVMLVDGVVAGVWAMGSGDTDLEVRVAAFDSLTERQWAAVEEEVGVIGRLAGSESTTLIRTSGPPNLRAGRRNLFMRPV